MISSPTVWMSALGGAFFVAGLIAYRNELFAPSEDFSSRAFALAPVFIAASMATFGGEHFTLARGLSQMVPKFMPARLFIAYFVGVAHVSAALSFVARRYLRWSTFFLGMMFALFVLLLHLPGAIENPQQRIRWIVAVRETTFSLGAFSLFAIAVRDHWPSATDGIASVARLWCGGVLIFYGILHFWYPRLSPGVPDSQPTASWVPLPLALACLTGALLVAFGVGMWVRRFAGYAAIGVGILMLGLTILLYVPQFFLAHGAAEQVNAINFVADTLLFAGTALAIGSANRDSEPKSMKVLTRGAA
jgi:uncharacterized membrane protein